MPKLIVSTFMSLDGVVDDPQRWALDYQDATNARDALDLLRTCSALVLGRVTYETLEEELPADKPTHVVSRTRGDGIDLEGVRELKNSGGGDLLTYGSPTLTDALLDEGLVDEMVFLVSPVVVGRGRRFFREGGPRRRLRLASVRPYEGGMVALRVRPIQRELSGSAALLRASS